MRIAAVGDVHGRESLPSLRADLSGLGPADLFLLAGDITDHSDLDGYEAVLRTVRESVRAPIWAVFGNNEYEPDHPKYVARFSEAYGVRFLEDEVAAYESGGRTVRIIGSTGCLDRPTWWQRKNLPHMADVYRRRIDVLDGLLAGDDVRVLLTHYPPTYLTMGGEKDEWRPELGCKALEPVLLRRRPALIVHGHVHKGIPFAELRPSFGRLEDFAAPSPPLPVHNVAYPVRHAVSTFDL